jgi:tetratricopeptide (TPR) repeat protein
LYSRIRLIAELISASGCLLRLLDEAVQRKQPALDKAERHPRDAVARRRTADLSKAMAAYDKAIELDPKSAALYHARAVAFARKGEHDRGVADYSKAIELDPMLAEAYFNRGRAYAGKGDKTRAAADSDQASKLK